MKRTIKNGDIIFDGIHTREQLEKTAFKELETHQDIEEELGISLITLFYALKYGVYYYFGGGNQLTRDNVGLISDYVNMSFHEKLSYSFITGFERRILPFDEYGKTWALTKEELE